MFHAWRGIRELVLLGALWGVYSLSRLLASAELEPALARAQSVLETEQFLGLHHELSFNHFVAGHEVLAVASSYYYAAAHYLVTAAVLGLLWYRGPQIYQQARNGLVLATVMALAAYITMPTAPPRFVPGYLDVLAENADLGWWGAGHSLPGEMGQLTNELAAMPSMHAGWALWVALAVALVTRNPWLRSLGWAHALLTGLVVIGTGNHWTLDVLIGWAVVSIAWALASRLSAPAEAAVAARRSADVAAKSVAR
ncbi:phosphatase PAP2 family protein [Kineosporia babensis]|uniref:Phosphatase PAP2 family protein n=1 Tax=Kineosporia babensis TaxID=499548 RepID=A0A9X1SW99_9ACTN|nr:phosphatase PAP2 family protein [Kineosporia babensis]MCD5314546.1 phosphatase PAP2 family protein [Kineosporia babensis]